MVVLLRILIISLIALSCQSEQNKDKNKIVTFDLKERPKLSTVKLSELGFIDIEYIPLETKESSFISWSNNPLGRGKIRFGGRFYIVKNANNILKFRDNGLFEKKIGTVGRGPNEFLVSHDVQVDEQNQEIYLLARWQKKFFVYSENGNLIRTFQIPFSPNEFNFLGNDILCYSENHMGDIKESYNLIDTNGRIIRSFPNKYPFKNHDAYGGGGENLFYKFGKRLFKKEVYSDTIYMYEKEDFKPHIVIQVGDKLLTPKVRSDYDGLYLAKNFISPMNLFEFGDFIYYEFFYEFNLGGDTKVYGFIGSKEKDIKIFFDQEQGIINDLDGGINIFPITTKDDNTIIALVDALLLKTHVASEAFKNSVPKYPEKKKELEKLAKSLKETDNPVLMIVSLKK